jgi:hypothetical protein
MPRSRTYVIATFIFCLSGVARADDRATADGMIARGLERRREGKPEEALEQFQRAHALAPSARTLGHMGIVEGTLKHWTDAEDHLTAALALSSDAWVKKNQGNLQSALDNVKPHIGQLVFSGSPGATVAVAGKPAGTLPNVGPVRVAAGTVLVTATAPNSKQFVERVEVQGGMQTAVTINLQPVDIQAPPPPPAPTPALAAPITEMHPHYTWKTWTGGALVAVGAGLATWGIVWIAVDGNSAGGTCADATVANCRHVYDTKTPGWILTAGGAAAVAAGGFLLYRAQSSGTDIALSLGPSSLVLGGHF